MYYKVKEIAELAGVSVRTLHHYDEIGILKPESVSEAGYRLYADCDLEKLQQILFFKEIGFGLKEIETILSNPAFNRREALETHKKLLSEKAKRIENMIETIEKTVQSMNGGQDMSKEEMFTAFDTSKIEALKNQYAQEAKEKYGHTDAYKESMAKHAKYSKDEFATIVQKGENIYKKIASLMHLEAHDALVQIEVENLRQYITDYFYNCTVDIFSGLSELYIADERFTKNIDQHGNGLALYLSEAMKIYCANKRLNV